MRRWLQPDRWGMGLAITCAVHCAAVPLLFAFVPALTVALHSFREPLRPTALWLLRSQAYDHVLVAVALVFALLCLVLGWRRHRRLRPLGWWLAALPAFAFGLSPTGMGLLPHVFALILGGTLLALSHWSNLRLRKAALSAPRTNGGVIVAEPQFAPLLSRRQCHGS